MASEAGIGGTGAASEPLRNALRDLRRLDRHQAIATIVDGYRRHNLLIYGSAIALRVFLAIIPVLLFAFGLLGFLGLSEVWRQDIVADIKPHVSPALFQVIDDTVTHVLSGKQFFWATAGALIAVWEMSGAVRAVMKATNSIYETEERRSLLEQFTTSLLLATAVGGLLLFAVGVVKFGPLLTDELFGPSLAVAVVSFVIRWALAIAALLLATGLLVRAGPDKERPLLWVGYGSALVVGAWVVSSIAFGLYLTQIAHYESVFGNLATVFIALEYVYFSALVFLTGLLVDSLTRERVERT
jgi:membrane protein